MREIKGIAIHHTGTRVDHSLDDIEQWHSNRGFYWEHDGKCGSIGYHFAVNFNAKWMSHETHPQLRPRELEGAHTKGYNHYLGVVIFGSYFFSMNQWWALGDGVYNLLKEYKLEVEDVYGHGELRDTECPGLDMDLFRSKFIKPWR